MICLVLVLCITMFVADFEDDARLLSKLIYQFWPLTLFTSCSRIFTTSKGCLTKDTGGDYGAVRFVNTVLLVSVSRLLKYT